MLELMKKPTINGAVDLEITGVPASVASLATAAIVDGLKELGYPVQVRNNAAQQPDPLPIGNDGERLYATEEVFGPRNPGRLVRGARYREGLKQKDLASMIGVSPSNLSEMENGKRVIGLKMAKRLGKALQTDYRLFL